MLKSNVFEYTVNDGRDDISSAPTRFLLIRNLESEITPQKVVLELIFSVQI